MGRIISEKRPWGYFERFTLNERTTVKLIHIKSGKRLSYQYHNRRSELWRVVKGKISLTLNGKTKTLSEGDTIKIPLRAKHRIKGLVDSVVLEISYGKFDEKDIVRLTDDYNRAR